MLASILGTLASAIGHLKHITRIEGEPFSIGKGVREKRGSLWMPYAANQVAAMRGLVSCWMNIAILETLSLSPARDRRIWFQVDELDALGRIEGLKDAQAPLRKSAAASRSGSSRSRRSRRSIARVPTSSSRIAGTCCCSVPAPATAGGPRSSPPT